MPNESGHELCERFQVRNANQGAPFADHDFWLRSDKVRPLPGNGADLVVFDLQQKEGPVVIVPLADAGELLTAERVEGMGDPYKVRA